MHPAAKGLCRPLLCSFALHGLNSQPPDFRSAILAESRKAFSNSPPQTAAAPQGDGMRILRSRNRPAATSA